MVYWGNAQTIRCALHDEHDGLYKLWYTTATVVSRPGTPAGAFEIDYGGPSHTCLATSTDGLSWDKPELGIVDYEGSRANNILEPPLAGSAASVKGWFIDPREADPARRYTTLARSAEADPEVVRQRQADPDVYYEMDPEHAETLREKGNWSCLRWDLFHSGDGLRWTPFVGNPVRLDPPQARTWAGPTRLMGWDPIRQVYAVYMESCQHARAPLMKRLIGRAESPDMIRWSRPETVLLPDGDDPDDTQFYHAAIGADDGLYVGVVGCYYARRGVITPQLVISRDGVRYERPCREPLIPTGPAGAFDGREIYAETPLQIGDQTVVYYTGRVGGHGSGPPYERAWNADETYAGIGAAVRPRDGLACLEAGDETGEIVTRAFTFDGDHLRLNVGHFGRDIDAMEVRVELLGPAHHHIDGRRMADADPIATPGLAHAVRWRGDADLSRLRGEPLKLRIQLRNASLRSFEFAT